MKSNTVCGCGLNSATSRHPDNPVFAENKKTHVRYVDQSEGAFDISYTNYVDIADTEDYAKSEKLDGTRSGAHTNPLVGATYKEVHGSLCDAYWDGRCSNMILPNYPGANRPMEYSCVP